MLGLSDLELLFFCVFASSMFRLCFVSLLFYFEWGLFCDSLCAQLRFQFSIIELYICVGPKSVDKMSLK